MENLLLIQKLKDIFSEFKNNLEKPKKTRFFYLRFFIIYKTVSTQYFRQQLVLFCRSDEAASSLTKFKIALEKSQKSSLRKFLEKDYQFFKGKGLAVLNSIWAYSSKKEQLGCFFRIQNQILELQTAERDLFTLGTTVNLSKLSSVEYDAIFGFFLTMQLNHLLQLWQLIVYREFISHQLLQISQYPFLCDQHFYYLLQLDEKINNYMYELFLFSKRLSLIVSLSPQK